MTDETNKILSDEEIKDKILSLDIAKECYAYYYKILYDKYLQLLKCHQSEAAIRADQNKKIGEDLTKILLDDTIKNSISRCRTITDYVADNLIAKLQKGEF